jgi:hypothetical protein
MKLLHRIISLAIPVIYFSGFIFGIFYVEAMGWPSLNAVLVRNFGANENRKPVLGMVFAGETEVIAAESGEVIFSRGGNNSQLCFAASRLPSPLGAWTAIDHEDGLISIYSRYKYEPDHLIANLTQIEKEQPIASSGISGWSNQEGFYFKIFDRQERCWINPAMIITPMQETTPPRIISVELRDTQGLITSSRNLTQGRYTVVVNAAGGTGRISEGISAGQFAPHRIVCSVNGVEVGSLNFESAFARDGVLMVSRNGLVAARQVYSNYPAFEVSEVFLTRGQVNLEIIVQDITGASRSIINRFDVN